MTDKKPAWGVEGETAWHSSFPSLPTDLPTALEMAEGPSRGMDAVGYRLATEEENEQARRELVDQNAKAAAALRAGGK